MAPPGKMARNKGPGCQPSAAVEELRGRVVEIEFQERVLTAAVKTQEQLLARLSSQLAELAAQRQGVRIDIARAENDATTSGLLSLDAQLLATVAACLPAPELIRLARVCRRFSIVKSLPPPPPPPPPPPGETEAAREERVAGGGGGGGGMQSVVEEGARQALEALLGGDHRRLVRQIQAAHPGLESDWVRLLWLNSQRWGFVSRPSAIVGESKRLLIESPWSQFTSECQRFGHPPRLDKKPF
jgi:hypothetical protein